MTRKKMLQLQYTEEERRIIKTSATRHGMCTNNYILKLVLEDIDKLNKLYTCKVNDDGLIAYARKGADIINFTYEEVKNSSVLGEIEDVDTLSLRYELNTYEDFKKEVIEYMAYLK